jgi:N-methylhydantoinase A
MRLDPALAEAAVQRVAMQLGLDLHTAARGILAIADSNMMGAIRVVSVERGHDPRDFSLVAFGGAGPLHGCALAVLLGITTVIIPPAPGVLCAEGLLAADLKAEFHRTLPQAGLPDEAAAAEIIAALRTEARAWLTDERIPPADRLLADFALMRYEGQGGELAVPWPGSTDAAYAGFVEAHRALYGFSLDAPIELVTLRVEAIGRLPEAVATRLGNATNAAAPGRRDIHFATRTLPAAVHERAALGAGQHFDGPAIVTQLDATTLVPPGWRCEVHAAGALLLRRISAKSVTTEGGIIERSESRDQTKS